MIATHTGEAFGVPASGQAVRVRGVELWRCSDGKIGEHWGAVDMSDVFEKAQNATAQKRVQLESLGKTSPVPGTGPRVAARARNALMALAPSVRVTRVSPQASVRYRRLIDACRREHVVSPDRTRPLPGVTTGHRC